MSILIVSEMAALCRKEHMTMQEAVNVIANYILMRTGKTLNCESVTIGDVTKFERMITIASAYFIGKAEQLGVNSYGFRFTTNPQQGSWIEDLLNDNRKHKGRWT